MALSTTQKKKPRAVPSQGGMTVSANPTRPQAAGRGLAPSAMREGGAAYQGRTDNVADVAAGMMNQDSALMQRAKAKGLAMANSRGLMNSTMAAQAVQGATLDQIVPMASQTAGQEFEKNRAGQQFQIDSEGAWRDEGIAERADERQFGYQSDLSAQESRQRMGETDNEYARRMELSGQESGQRINETAAEYAQRSKLSAQESGQRINETDAEYAQRMKLTNREGEIASDLSRQESGQRVNETAAEYAQRRGLSAQEARQTSDLSRQESQQRVGETRAEYLERTKLSEKEAQQLQDQTKLEYSERGGLSAQEAEQARKQALLEADQDRKTAGYESGLRQNEAAQQFKFDKETIKLDAQMQQQLAKQGFDFDKELASIDNTFKTKQIKLENTLKDKLADKQITAETARGAETALNNAFNDHQGIVSNILNNPNLSAKERKSQIAAANANVTKRIDMMESMYSIDFKWPGTGTADTKGRQSIRNIGK